jgi:hypothetical protein
MIFGDSVVIVEWSFEANHKGPFAGRAATGSAVKLPGCGVYEFDPVTRTITAGGIFFDVTNVTQTDFITPASGAAEPSPVVVCFAGFGYSFDDFIRPEYR